MRDSYSWMGLAAIVIQFVAVQPAGAIVEPDNQGRWTKPTDKGPDKEVPGFLVNLGPTGARAVLKEKSLVVKHIFAGSPAEKQLQIDDEIVGVNGHKFGKHVFGKFYGMKYDVGYEGPIMDMGNAIEECEGRDGILKLNLIRDNEQIAASVKLPAVGSFSDRYPSNCRKSQKLASDAMDYLLGHTGDYTGAVHEKGVVGLALLAQGKTKEAEKLAMAWNEMPGEKAWTWYPSYQCIFLCEYHLMTGDTRVLKTIEGLAKRLYLAQVVDPSLYTERMHGGRPQAKNYLKGGLGHGARIAGYGTMTITTLMALLSWELAEDCGIEIDSFHRDLAYENVHTHTHESGYMGYRFATGAYTPVGRQGLSIIVHRLAGNMDKEDEKHVKAVTRGLVNARTRLNDGHGDNALAVLWALLGIQLSGDEAAVRSMFDYNKAFINMARTHDGAFVIQPGRNAAEKAYYMSPRIHPTAAMVLALGSGQSSLRMQGKSD